MTKSRIIAQHLALGLRGLSPLALRGCFQMASVKRALNVAAMHTCCNSISRRLYSIEYDRSSIFSLASGHGKCGVSVIRVSGPASGDALMSLGRFKKLPRARNAVLRKMYDPSTALLLDRGLVLWFPGPHSFTGEDSCELHVHGGLAVVSATLTALSNIPGLRQAEAGEFAKRAFQNSKLDLNEVEALADLIDSETEQQRRQALRQMDGDVARLVSDWRDRLLNCVASLEAFIDFGEEDDLDEGALLKEVQEQVECLTYELSGHLVDKRVGERLRNGVHVAIIGEPNVGKSSLLNALCRRSAAIVSPIAGTTRDVLEVAMDIGGYPVVISDTAGLRHNSADPVEREGVRRAIERSTSADIRILVFDSSELTEDEFKTLRSSNHLQNIIRDRLHRFCSEINIEDDDQSSYLCLDDVIVVFNKSDLVGSSQIDAMRLHDDDVTCCLSSCETENGIQAVLTLIESKVKAMCPVSGNSVLMSVRHHSHLNAVVTSLQNFSQRNDVVQAAGCLRTAQRHLGRLSGNVSMDEVLDAVFSRFCIGK